MLRLYPQSCPLSAAGTYGNKRVEMSKAGLAARDTQGFALLKRSAAEPRLGSQALWTENVQMMSISGTVSAILKQLFMQSNSIKNDFNFDSYIF